MARLRAKDLRRDRRGRESSGSKRLTKWLLELRRLLDLLRYELDQLVNLPELRGNHLKDLLNLAPALQGKLLRVLQEKEVHPLGASAPVPVDARIITATHRDLTALVAEERFRQDLLYRINVIEVQVPPLRERPDDLVPLIRHLLDKQGTRLGKPGCTVSAAAMQVLRRHTWPGNVRELENVIERALVLGTGTTITVGSARSD
jgi:transcriptional regulator with PAS, ATPase and Fis domain